MGSSKGISSREVFQMIILLQQGGLFWLLPVLLLQENGTAGLFLLLPGVLTGIVILLVCAYWRNRCAELSFPQSLEQILGKPAGKVVTCVFVVLYMIFAILCLNSFIEVLHTQLLPDTPRIVLLVPVFILTGWLAWNGLEDIARLTVPGVLLILFLMLLTVAGSSGSFAPENMLPLQVKKPEQMMQAAQHSIFFYSSLLVLFMVYPALQNMRGAKWKMPLASIISAVLFLFWSGLALGVFGQFSMERMLWLPVELARMIQISSFLERTEAMFTALWMPVVLINGALLLWSVSAGVHQLIGKQKSGWLHGLLILAVFLLCVAIDSLTQLFYVEKVFASVTAGLVPLLLFMIFTGTWLYSRRKRRESP